MCERGTRDGLGFSRAVNERILELSPALLAESDLLRLVCECRSAGCEGLLEMTVPEFDAVRAEAGLYAVLPGHERRGLSPVVGRCDRYVLVKMPREAAASRAARSSAAAPSRAARTSIAG
jgi:hypothetical protein